MPLSCSYQMRAFIVHFGPSRSRRAACDAALHQRLEIRTSERDLSTQDEKLYIERSQTVSDTGESIREALRQRAVRTRRTETARCLTRLRRRGERLKGQTRNSRLERLEEAEARTAGTVRTHYIPLRRQTGRLSSGEFRTHSAGKAGASSDRSCDRIDTNTDTSTREAKR
jgi:hypothetical protein